MDTCMCITDSLYCKSETTIVVNQLYFDKNFERDKIELKISNN